jgi:hypothetical protein
MDVREELAFLFWGLMASMQQGLDWIKANPFEAFLLETGLVLLMMSATWRLLTWIQPHSTRDEDPHEPL